MSHEEFTWPINLDPRTVHGAVNLTAFALIGAAAGSRPPQLTGQQQQWLKGGCCLRCGRPNVRPAWRKPQANDPVVCWNCKTTSHWQADVLNGRTDPYRS